MKNLTVLSLLIITSVGYAQSPWVKKKGEIYSQLSFSTISNYDKLIVPSEPNKEKNTPRKITDNTLQLYGEIGLTDNLTLTVNVPLKIIKSGDSNPNFGGVGPPHTTAESKTALGNIEIGIRRVFYKKEWIISGQLSTEINTSTFYKDSGLRTGYDTWTITPLFLAGRGYEKMYLQFFTGVNLRVNKYSSNFKIGGEFGYKVLRKIWLATYIDISKSFKNKTLELLSSNELTGLYINDQEYGAVGLKAIGELTYKFGLTASFGSVFFANNLPKKIALNAGLYYKF